MKQTTNTLLMVRPASFRKNEETAVNNYYQKDSELAAATVTAKAKEEFDNFVTVLRAHGVEVVVMQDEEQYDTPDAVFPNNWISFHENGDIGLYPMFAPNRRRERRPEVVFPLLEDQNYSIANVVDYTTAEEEGFFLEGTGSMVLDRANRKAYCALSPRADEELFIEFCEDFEYTPVLFVANQTMGKDRLPIYHTNVMMCVGETFAVICLSCIDDKKERKNVSKQLKADGKAIVDITEAQLQQFAGNMLQVVGADQKRFLVMSTAAYESLTAAQRVTLEQHTTILHSSLETIERHGGGSARCMMAEVFLPKK